MYNDSPIRCNTGSFWSTERYFKLFRLSFWGIVSDNVEALKSTKTQNFPVTDLIVVRSLPPKVCFSFQHVLLTKNRPLSQKENLRRVLINPHTLDLAYLMLNANKHSNPVPCKK